MRLDDLAARNSKRLELSAALSSTDTSTYTALAVSDSSNGAVDVIIADDVAKPSYDEGTGLEVELPTTVSVKAGDTVLVTGYGGAVLETPVVTGNMGGGDRMQSEVDEAHELAASVEGIAQEAIAVATATGQHFWAADDGVHVTEVTQEQFEETPTGANMLANSNGILLRDGETYMSAFTPDGMVVYDGSGNDAGNVVAQFTADGARIGYANGANVSITESTVTFADESGNVAGTMASGAEIPTKVSNTQSYLIKKGATRTLTYSGVPDFTSGDMTITYGDSSLFSHELNFSDYGTKTVSGYGTLAVAAADGGFTLTVTTEESSSSMWPYTYVFGATWYTTRKEPLLTWDGHISQAVKTASLNLTNLGSGTKTLNLWREGNVVHANMVSTATASTANTAITCGTIPEGFRPIKNEFMGGPCIVNNAFSGNYRWRVATNGEITYWCSAATIKESPLCMTWITDDEW